MENSLTPIHAHNGRTVELSRRKSLGIAGAEILGFGLSAILEQPDKRSKTQAGIALVSTLNRLNTNLLS